MRALKEADLILNRDGSVYHLKLRPENIADTILIVGDPQRVSKVSRHFDRIEFRQQNREFITHTGFIGPKRLSVMSTGIGPDNIDIVMNELDALASFNLQERTRLKEQSILKIIRLGTSGSIQPGIGVDSFVLASHGLGLDGSLSYYGDLDGVIDSNMTRAFIGQTSWPDFLPRPAIIPGSAELLSKLDQGFHKGITATAPGFYAPQGRILRLPLAFPEMIDRISSFEYLGNRVVNFEMETATLYGLGRMLGHQVASICVTLANRVEGTYSRRYKKVVEKLIDFVLERMTI